MLLNKNSGVQTDFFYLLLSSVPTDYRDGEHDGQNSERPVRIEHQSAPRGCQVECRETPSFPYPPANRLFVSQLSIHPSVMAVEIDDLLAPQPPLSLIPSLESIHLPLAQSDTLCLSCSPNRLPVRFAQVFSDLSPRLNPQILFFCV